MANWFKEGVIVLISNNPLVEQIHVFNQLPWNRKQHSQWLGKVGYISSMKEDEDSAVVKFFKWDTSQMKHLVEVDLLFHSRALRPVQKLHFLCGDRAVLGRLNRGRRHFNMVSLRIFPNRENSFSLKMFKGYPFDWSQSRYPNDILLPIYQGENRIYREKFLQINEDSNIKRIVYGKLSCPTSGTELIHSLKTWSSHEGSLFQLALQHYPSQINEMKNGKTPLMVAVELSNWPAIVLLIAFSAQREAVDEENNTLLHLAAAKGDVRVLEGLLEFIERDINKVNIDGDTALHLAARKLNAACVDRILCVPNVHSNIANNLGETVLHEICSVPESTTSLTILSRILCNPRLNTIVSNTNGWTPIHLAIMRGNSKSVESMIISRPGLLNSSIPQPLVFAAMSGKNKVLDTILTLKHDFAVELQTLPDGKTSLHVTVESWQGDVDSDLARLACIQSLIACGIPIDAIDCEGQTASHLLVKYINNNPKPFDSMTLVNAIQCQKATMKLDEMAAKLRPHWQLACLCFFVVRGCDLTVVDSHGKSVIDLCNDEKLRHTLQLMVQNRLKCCLPMAVPANEFDTSEVHMCTFNCENSVADVQFIPCGHRVMCKQCAISTSLRRCPICYMNISSAVDLRQQPVELGVIQKTIEYRGQEKLAEVAKKANEEAECEKKKEIEALKEALEKLEMERSCAICLDARPSIVFNCGHTSCGDCGEVIALCHICRQPIQQKMTIYT